MAKDILERYITLQWDDSGNTLRDLTGDLVPGTLTGPGFTSPEIRMTGVSDTVENFLADRKDVEITAQFYMNDTATTGAYRVLEGTLDKVFTLLIEFGTGGVPASGDPTYAGEHVLTNADIAIVGGSLVMNARWKPGSSSAPVWADK